MDVRCGMDVPIVRLGVWVMVWQKMEEGNEDGLRLRAGAVFGRMMDSVFSLERKLHGNFRHDQKGKRPRAASFSVAGHRRHPIRSRLGQAVYRGCNSFVQIIPGHAHLDVVGRKVREAVREAGGVPFEFNTIGVDDGIAMGHGGMKYSLASRELIADCVETMLRAHCFDGMVCIPNCDKIVPGMLMAAVRVNIPDRLRQRRADEGRRERRRRAKRVDLITVFEGVGAHSAGKITREQLDELEAERLPDLRLVLRHVHRQLA